MNILVLFLSKSADLLDFAIDLTLPVSTNFLTDLTRNKKENVSTVSKLVML